MKKILAITMAAALLAVSAAALAEDSNQGNQAGGMPPQGQTGSFTQGSQPGGMPPQGQTDGFRHGGPGRNGRMPGGQMPGAQAPDSRMPGAQMPDAQAPGAAQPGTTPDSAAGEAPEGAPAQSAGEAPEGAPAQPAGEAPEGAPEQPVMIDFDAMVTKGVISQETCDKIKAYMEEHKPADLPQAPSADAAGQDASAQSETRESDTDGSASAEQPKDQAPGVKDGKETDTSKGPSAGARDRKPDGQRRGRPDGKGTFARPQGQAPEAGGLLADLLKDGIITQTEYDALIAAQAA